MSIHVTRETKKQNVVIDGVKYVAVVAINNHAENTCHKCALSAFAANLCRLDVAKCDSEQRADGGTVYFVVKPKKVKPKKGQS